MKVTRLSLRQFRNVEDASFEPHPRLNFLLGTNGQGKTSFLEALGYLSTLRSFRGSKAEEVIRWGVPSSEISCRISPDDSGDFESELKISFSQTGHRTTKTASINGKPFKSSSQYLSQRFGSVELGFHAIVFNPADHDLVRGEPAVRRAYLDRVLAAEEPDYLKDLLRYQRLLEQRNALLKADLPPSKEVLQGFTEPLAQLAARVTEQRLSWLIRLRESLDPVARKIAPSQPPLAHFYQSNWVPEISGLSIGNRDLTEDHFAGLPFLPSIENLEEAFWMKQSSLLQSGAELRARSTLIGPHRDDWGFALGRQLLKGHGSQGEVRTALLALKLSEIALFRKRTGHRPILLLDDFSSELDRQRRAFLLEYLADTDLQVFVTTTELPRDLQTAIKKFEVDRGTIAEQVIHTGFERDREKPDAID